MEQFEIEPATRICNTCKIEQIFELFKGKNGKHFKNCLSCRNKKKEAKLKVKGDKEKDNVDEKEIKADPEIKIKDEIKSIEKNSNVEKIEKEIFNNVKENNNDVIKQMQPEKVNLVGIEKSSEQVLGKVEIKEDPPLLEPEKMTELLRKFRVMTGTLGLKEIDVTKMSQKEFMVKYGEIYESYCLYIGSSNTEAIVSCGAGWLDLFNDYIYNVSNGNIITAGISEVVAKKQKQLRPYYAKCDLTDQLSVLNDHPFYMIAAILAGAVAENSAKQKALMKQRGETYVSNIKNDLDPKSDKK